MEFLDSTATVRGFVGGQGSGKSKVGAYDLLVRARAGRLYMVTAPTYKVLRDSTCRSFDETARYCGLLRKPISGEAFSAITTTLDGGEAEILFRSTEFPEWLRGPNLSGAWMDEASLSPLEAYQILTARLREGGELGWLTCTFTPKGRTHWTFQELASGRPNTFLVMARTADNPFLSEDFIQQVVQTYGTSALAKQELGGEFVTLEGAEWPPDYFTDDLWFDDWPQIPWICSALALDPSKGRDAKSGDYAAFVLMRLDEQGTLWTEADMGRGKSAELLAEQAVEHVKNWQPDAFGVETNQFQQLMAVIINQIGAKKGVLCPVVELLNTVNKAVRIRRLGPYLAQKKIRFRNTPSTHLLVDQLREFPVGDHDDGPDAQEMSLRVILSLLGSGGQTTFRSA